jgi:hypothetical protein
MVTVQGKISLLIYARETSCIVPSERPARVSWGRDPKRVTLRGTLEMAESDRKGAPRLCRTIGESLALSDDVVR